MIDLSDGLSTDLHHCCEQSRVSAEVAAERIPRAEGATLEHALHGGEDYELLFTAPGSARSRGELRASPLPESERSRTAQRGSSFARDFAVKNLLPADGNTSAIRDDRPDEVAC